MALVIDGWTCRVVEGCRQADSGGEDGTLVEFDAGGLDMTGPEVAIPPAVLAWLVKPMLPLPAPPAPAASGEGA